MPYDPELGLGLQNPDNLAALSHLGIDPVEYDIEAALAGQEPEGKISLRGPRGLNDFSTAVAHSSNAFFIPEQSHKSDYILISMVLNDPAGMLESHGLRLRLRFNYDPKNNEFKRADINIKSTLASAHGDHVQGMICRNEIENIIDLEKPILPQIQDFLAKTAVENPKIRCGDIKAETLSTSMLAHTHRTNYALCVAERSENRAHVFHACGDLVLYSTPFGEVLNPKIDTELEFECLQAFGYIPKKFNTMREFFTSALNGVTGHFLKTIPNATPVTDSKIERGENHLKAQTGFSTAACPAPSLTIEDFMGGNKSTFAHIAFRLFKAAEPIIAPEGSYNLNGGRAISLTPSICQKAFMALQAA